ncbi:MAG: 3-phosphoshikimate 1-carboxyvinyltransferase [Limisphaerales bacterium]|nr:hypothetical protein [Verrucomicrobiota bacterium]
MREWPEKIEIEPLSGLKKRQLTIPGSKSITNRALILAALAHGEVCLRGALWSEDTLVMVEAMRKLGVELSVEQEPEESSNRIFKVQGLGERRPLGGSFSHPLEIYIANSGTSARFLMAFLCASAGGWYRLVGTERMSERPQRELFQALRQLGYTIIAEREGFLPAVLGSEGPLKGGSCTVSQEESSQFASALLLSAERGQWQVEISGKEAGYLWMTRELLSVFPRGGGVFEIEPDASSGSYFYGANVWAQGYPENKPVSVLRWPSTGWQPDEAFPHYLPLPSVLSRENDLGDSIMTAIVLATQGESPVKFTELGRLRVQECERVKALRTELSRCGARVEEEGDTLTVYPSRLHGAEIETYNDHRMAFCFSLLGLGVAGMVIKNPKCAEKSFPSFFEKLDLLKA